MSTSSIKPTNHRVYPCPNDKKPSLLKQIISQNKDSKIIIVTSQDASSIKESLADATNAQVLTDDALFKDESITCDLLISLDLPQKAILYIKRLSHTTSKAILILNESEQKLLYPIETLLGRVIKQEIVEGFEYEKIEKKETKPKQKQMSKQDIKDVAKKRYDEGTRDPNEIKKEFKKPEGDKKFDKPRRDDDKAKQWEKKKKSPNKFLGKDEKGKALFSGKSGERNHRHDGSAKENYDAPKKIGKKISIKSLKKPEDKKQEDKKAD
ncbi:MAG: hypothetical protein M0Q24_04285 [Sulfurimonas sp.]|uniref:hypothetical protein n=1 Tax=Sulfurimonas sp. TaxID=2022749 RepID=UPI0025E992DB|nr:hypothetical protein [Sulfurimonas sp.]MCK9491285.1 hypothetical protein [Sulfurimonas sp.]